MQYFYSDKRKEWRRFINELCSLKVRELISSARRFLFRGNFSLKFRMFVSLILIGAKWCFGKFSFCGISLVFFSLENSKLP